MNIEVPRHVRNKALAIGANAWLDALPASAPTKHVGHAVACVQRRKAAYNPDRARLLHGDVHQWNALSTGHGSFKLVDPDGLRCEPEYDLGILMREDPEELMAGDPYDRASLLTERTGLDAEAIWEWGVVERVSTALVCLQINLQPVGDQMLAAAEAIAASA